jgi:hypothetical protein
MMDVTSPAVMDRTTWNSMVSLLPDPHILQAWEWGKVKNELVGRPVTNTGMEATLPLPWCLSE